MWQFQGKQLRKQESGQGKWEEVKGLVSSILQAPSAAWWDGAAGAASASGFGKTVQLDETPRWSSVRP